MAAWLKAASDPAIDICSWLWQGAPAGLAKDFDCLDGIFPRVIAGDPELDPSELGTDAGTFVNYHGVEQDDDVDAVIKGYIRKEYLKPFDTLETRCWPFPQVNRGKKYIHSLVK